MSSHLNKRISKLEERVSHLERPNAPGQHNPEAIAPHQHPNENGEAGPRKSATADGRPNDRTNAPDKQQPDGHQWWIRMWAWKPWRRVLTVLVGLAGIAYAVVTYYQWRDLRNNFKATERAWIKVTAPLGPLDSILPVKAVASNVGKSIALYVKVTVKFAVVPKGQSFLPKKGEAIRFHERYWQSMFPSDVHPFEIWLYDVHGNERSLSTDEASAILSGASYVVAYGVVGYSDQFGPHWTRFCNWRAYASGTYMADPCVSYNSVGDGPTAVLFP